MLMFLTSLRQPREGEGRCASEKSKILTDLGHKKQTICRRRKVEPYEDKADEEGRQSGQNREGARETMLESAGVNQRRKVTVIASPK